MRDNTLLRFYKGFFLEETINGTKVHLYKEDNFVLIRECENTEEAKERIDTQTIQQQNYCLKCIFQSIEGG